MRVKLNQDVTVWDIEGQPYNYSKGTEFDVIETFAIAELNSGEKITLPEEMFSGDELKGVHIKDDGTLIKNEDIKVVEHGKEVQALDTKWTLTLPNSYLEEC